MLAVGCCGWDDKEGTERLIESCWRKVDLIFYINGWYKHHEEPISITPNGLDDNDFLNKYPNVIKIDVYDKFEYQKRQVYLDLCEQWCIDWLLVVDTDEYFHPDSNFEEFIEERKRVCNDRDHLYNLKNYTEIDRLLLPLDQPRLIHFPSQIHYLNGHHYQLAINGTDEAITAKDTLYSVKLCHDPHLRSQERKDKHDEYIKWLKRYEAEKMLDETPKEKENRLVSVWSGN